MAYRQGVGPDRLPQGAAQQVNANQPPPAEDPFGALAMENTDIPVQFAPGNADLVPEDDSDSSDDLQILMEHPDPNYQPSAVRAERPGRIPRYTVRHLAQFRAAATAPDAPPGLRALYNATVRQLEQERRAGR